MIVAERVASTAVAKRRLSTVVVLPDEEIVQMRELRATAGLEWPVLGERFRVHEKTAYRICTGMTRMDAGGPIEPKRTRPDWQERPATRCRCGGLVYELPCKLCAFRTSAPLVRLVVEALRDSGILDECQFNRGVRRILAPHLRLLQESHSTAGARVMLKTWTPGQRRPA